MTWPNFYEQFWSGVKKRHPHLATSDTLRRSADDDSTNYHGHKLPRFGPVYLHVSFTGKGTARTMRIELYTSQRKSAGWTDAQATVERLVPGALPIREPKAKKHAARWWQPLATDITLETATADIGKLVDHASGAYREFSDLLGWPEK